MKKRILSLFIALALAISMFPKFALSANATTIKSGNCGESLQWQLDDSGTLTISGTGRMFDFDNVGPWYEYNRMEQINRIVIAEGVTYIGQNAFLGCFGVANVSISNSVTQIGHFAFSACSSLKTIEIPDSVTTIGSYAFSDCDSLETIAIPASVISLGDGVFSCSWNLKSITFIGNVPSMYVPNYARYEYGTFDCITATIYHPINPTWTDEVLNKYYGGTITWATIETNNTQNSESTLEEESLTDAGYIAAIQRAIDDTQVVGWGSGYGALYDVDGNGIEELLLLYTANLSPESDYFSIATVCSVYTLSGGNAVPLLEKEYLYYEAGSPWGYVGVVKKDGQTYLATTSSNSSVCESTKERIGSWMLYTLNGTSLTQDTTLEYTRISTDNTVVYSKSSVTINGQDFGYATYEEWEKGIEELFAVFPYDVSWSPQHKQTMTLENLLEYLKENPIEDTSASQIEETAELKVYTTFPYATLGVDQTAKLLITLLVNGEPTPIQEFTLRNNNSKVIDLVDTKDADGVRVVTFKTLSPGVANLTFTEGATGATVSIKIAVEDMCSYYRCSNFPIPDASSFPIHVANFQCTENTDGTHNVQFNAYNTSYAYGAAIVYDETGAFRSCVPLNPKYDGTGMEYIANGFWQSWEQTWYWIDGDKEFYEVAGNAMLTEVEFNNIPQNAKIVITSDGSESVYPVLYTGIDIFLKVAFYSANIDLKTNVYQKSVQDFVVALLKALPDDAMQNTIQTLTADISMALIDGVNSESMEKIYQAVWNMFENLGLNADEMLKDVLSGLGYSVADTVVIAAVPAYSFVDLVNKIVAVAWLFVDYDSNLNRGKMEIHCVEHASNNQLVNSSVIVIQQSEFSKDTILDAYVVTDAEELGTIPDSVTSDIENYSIYNITLRERGAEVQPSEEIEIRVPIPENVNPEKCVIYRLEDDSTLTLLPSTTENGYIVFTTTHLSYYIVGESTDKTAEVISANSDNNGALIWIVCGVVTIGVTTLIIIMKRKKSNS